MKVCIFLPDFWKAIRKCANSGTSQGSTYAEIGDFCIWDAIHTDTLPSTFHSTLTLCAIAAKHLTIRFYVWLITLIIGQQTVAIENVLKWKMQKLKEAIAHANYHRPTP